MINKWLIFLFVLVLSSCMSQKDLLYVRNLNVNEKFVSANSMLTKEIVIGTGDMLSISVDGVDRESIRPFNIQHDLNPTIRTYLVDTNGDIIFPVIGKIHVSGLTKSQIIKVLDEKLVPFLKSPTITVQLENFQVSVLGEVNRPGKYQTQNDRISIFDALSLAGDITIYGVKRNILVTRELNGKIEFARLDLTNPEIFKSEYYYLKQNDVIYVEPSRAKPLNTQNSLAQLSIASIVVTLVSSIVLYIKK